MVNFKLGETNVKTKWSEFHERGTKKKSESPTGFEPLTPTQIFSLSHVRDMLIISFSFKAELNLYKTLRVLWIHCGESLCEDIYCF